MTNRAQRWPFWRKTMLAGALWLLVVAVIEGGLEPQSGFLGFAAFAIGYGLLAVGFFSAMNERSRRSPPDDEQKR